MHNGNTRGKGKKALSDIYKLKARLSDSNLILHEKKKNIKCQYRQFYNYKRLLNHIFLYLIACNFNVGPIMDKCNVFDNNSTNKDGQK